MGNAAEYVSGKYDWPQDSDTWSTLYSNCLETLEANLWPGPHACIIRTPSLWLHTAVDEKLISRSKKDTDNFI